MSALREYALSNAYEAVVSKASFRKPQHDAFEKFHQLMRALGGNIPSMTSEALASRISDLGYLEALPPNLIFDLATGVGKTRLLGALLVYLALSRQTKNCLILASRVTILDKLKRECDPASPKYLFIDRSLIPNPNICFRGDMLSFEPNPMKLNVFILSPQTLTGTRVGIAGDFGPSLRDYLINADDLIVFSDEAHHLGNKSFGAWSEAVGQLCPKLHLGFTATAPSTLSKQVLYSYSLNTCLKEAKFTKAVKLWVEPKPGDIADDDWDYQTIDFALQRLEAKKQAIAGHRHIKPEFPEVSPVLLVAAKDISHAEKIGLWLEKYRGLDETEIYIAHSKKKSAAKVAAINLEAEVARLVAVDQPGNKIKVVVNVFQLSEGWDVTNVWVIAPLRSLASFSNAIQTIGRGLRLPAGRRVGDDEIDTLDVLCFGKEDFETIVQQATKEFGCGAEGSAAVSIVGKGEHRFSATRRINLQIKKAVECKIPQVVRTPGEPELNFSPEITRGISSYIEVYDVGSGEFGTDDGSAARRSFEAVVRAATSHVMDRLRFLDPVKHTPAVRKIIERVLSDLGGSPGMLISTDAVKLGLAVSEEIKSRYRSIESAYVAGGVSLVLKLAPVEVSIPVAFEEIPTVDQIVKWK